jgi:hypothetical protein
MKALDKLGRILFMFYWHQEEFEDRYGKQDLPELEDSIRNAFEVLGDVVLFLKEKTVQSRSGVEMGSGVGNTAEPNIEEAARSRRAGSRRRAACRSSSRSTSRAGPGSTS